MQSSKGCVRLRDALKCIGMHLGGHCYSRVELLTSKCAERLPYKLMYLLSGPCVVYTLCTQICKHMYVSMPLHFCLTSWPADLLELPSMWPELRVRQFDLPAGASSLRHYLRYQGNATRLHTFLTFLTSKCSLVRLGPRYASTCKA